MFAGIESPASSYFNFRQSGARKNISVITPGGWEQPVAQQPFFTSKGKVTTEDIENRYQQILEQQGKSVQFIHKVSAQDLLQLCYQRSKDLQIVFDQLQVDRFFYKFDKYCRNRVLQLNNYGFGDHSKDTICKILRSTSNFAKLQLNSNQLRDDASQRILETIVSTKNIIHLELQNNSISGAGAERLFEILLDNTTLISIDLSSQEGLNRNKMTNNSCRALKQLLAKNTILQFINIANCRIGQLGLGIIIEGLKQNQQLLSLNLAQNSLGANCGKQIIQIIQASKIQELNLAGNQLTDKPVVELAECKTRFEPPTFFGDTQPCKRPAIGRPRHRGLCSPSWLSSCLVFYLFGRMRIGCVERSQGVHLLEF